MPHFRIIQLDYHHQSGVRTLSSLFYIFNVNKLFLNKNKFRMEKNLCFESMAPQIQLFSEGDGEDFSLSSSLKWGTNLNVGLQSVKD